MADGATAAATVAALRRLPASFALRQCIASVERQVRTRGAENFRRSDIGLDVIRILHERMDVGLHLDGVDPPADPL